MSETIKMTDEVRAKLLGLLPMSKSATHTFIPDTFINTEVDEMYLPSFTVRQLTNEEAEEVTIKGIQDLLDSVKKTKLTAKGIAKKAREQKAFFLKIVKACTVEWFNYFNYETLELIEFGEDGYADMKDIVLNDIYTEILKVSGLAKV